MDFLELLMAGNVLSGERKGWDMGRTNLGDWPLKAGRASSALLLLDMGMDRPEMEYVGDETFGPVWSPDIHGNSRL
jgi:hypothetical protein